MKRFITSVVLLVFCCLTQSAFAGDYKDVADSIIAKLQLDPNTYSYIKTIDAPSFVGYKAVLYELKNGPIVIPLAVYVSDNKNIGIFGEVFVAGKPLTKELGLQTSVTKLSFDLSVDDRIIFNADGKKTVFMFSDPECMFCQEALQKIRSYVGSDYRFIIKQFPVDPIHPSARAKAAKLQEDWLKQKYPQRSPADIATRAAQIMKQDDEEGKRAGVRGTPAFFMDGQFLTVLPIDNMETAERGH